MEDSKTNILIISSNQNKIDEIQNIINAYDDTINVEHCDINIPKMQMTVDVVSAYKCNYAIRYIMEDKNLYDTYKDYNILTEETSLHVNALNGMPGPYINWFIDSMGVDGVYKMISFYQDKTAKAISAVSLSTNISSIKNKTSIKKEIFTTCGETQGIIVKPYISDNDFVYSYSWDCMFQLDNYSIPYSQMDKLEKNKYSHRAMAMKNIIKLL